MFADRVWNSQRFKTGSTANYDGEGSPNIPLRTGTTPQLPNGGQRPPPPPLDNIASRLVTDPQPPTTPDEFLADEAGEPPFRHPQISTVTYLTDAGAPTCVVEKRSAGDGFALAPPAASHAAIFTLIHCLWRPTANV